MRHGDEAGDGPRRFLRGILLRVLPVIAALASGACHGPLTSTPPHRATDVPCAPPDAGGAACNVDTDCPTGTLCECHFSTLSGIGPACVPSTCRLDADCGAGLWCSSSPNTYCRGISGYHCHTQGDDCRLDAECGAGQLCVYAAENGKWVCRDIQRCQG